ncbi:MAG TPA: hypothetical protein VMC84_02235 [Methanocella sp.]|uniref:hypothetical protein n=1 Tax=Methanocella sp. TaxID=2052833 RepID=UPI002CD301D1|nr:hypothetical protein [Methanocella sp.]HTY89971.1 hypothetical protein [Methanocella sp.]
MKSRTIVISLLLGLIIAQVALLSAGAQYIPAAADQIMVNQPYGAANSNILPPACFAQPQYPYAAQPGVPAAVPFGACDAPLAAACTAPLAAPVVAYGPYTSGFTYSATQSSAYGPFTPPVTQATEQFYQYPGLTPYGAYPGAGYAAAGGIGYDPATGYYGPYGSFTPLI